MKKVLLFAGLFFLLFMTACQSADADEVLEYHNGYVENIGSKMAKMSVADEKIYDAETDEEAIDLMDSEKEPLLESMKEYMDKQDPEKDPAIEYHKLRKKAFDTFYESIRLDIETFRGIMDGSLTEEEIDENYDESAVIFEEAEKQQEEAEEKMEELSDKYKFKDEEDVEEN